MNLAIGATMRRLILAGSIFVAPLSSAIAEEPRLATGYDLFGSCVASPSDKTADLSCDSYINGITNGIFIDQVTREGGHPICLPDRTTTIEIRSVIEKFIRDNQNILALPAGGIVAYALESAFPCPK